MELPTKQAPAPAAATVGTLFTLSRLVLLPVAIAGIARGAALVAAGAVVAAVLSDLADGGLARLMGQYSKFNQDLDSTVDFVFIHCLFIALYVAGSLQTHQFAVVYAAMLGTLGLQLFAVEPGTGVVRTVFGRPTGAVEYAYLLVLIAGRVLPGNAVVALASRAVFVALVPAVVLYIAECTIKLRKQRAG